MYVWHSLLIVFTGFYRDVNYIQTKVGHNYATL